MAVRSLKLLGGGQSEVQKGTLLMMIWHQKKGTCSQNGTFPTITRGAAAPCPPPQLGTALLLVMHEINAWKSHAQGVVDYICCVYILLYIILLLYILLIYIRLYIHAKYSSISCHGRIALSRAMITFINQHMKVSHSNTVWLGYI